MLFVAFSPFFMHFTLTRAFDVSVKVKPGEDILLECQAPVGAVIRLLEWIRPDLKPQGDVFFYRNDRPYEKYQHPSFRGRVELRDPQMKGGDMSVFLKKVNTSDTGTYICRISVSNIEGDRTGTEFTSFTNLTVTDSRDSGIPVLGGEAGDTEDGGKTDQIITENKDVNVGLFVGISVFVVILCFFAFMIIRKNKCVKETFY